MALQRVLSLAAVAWLSIIYWGIGGAVLALLRPPIQRPFLLFLVRGAIGFGIRDFAQNYPKEIELAPEGTWLHLWPRHAPEVAKKSPPYSDYWRLGFCHEGRLLDFKIPEGWFIRSETRWL